MTIQKVLTRAQSNKKDDFYTRLVDIENELKHYKTHFKGKIVYCNADDPRKSNFYTYFSQNFKELGLKKLIVSCYKERDYNLFNNKPFEPAVYVEYTGQLINDRVPLASEVGLKEFVGDGDFRSKESIDLLKQADIVVTNPPFSLFRELVAQLIEHDKKFILLGNLNAITYKEIFPLIKDKKIWTGSIFNVGLKFIVPESYPLISKQAGYDADGNRLTRVPSLTWWTNLEIEKRHKDLKLIKEYKGNEKNYPKYNNYDVINVDKTKDIPKDYKGVMGVPITFLNRHNPEQFEIIGLCSSGTYSHYECFAVIGNRNLYHRILIKNKRL